MTQRFTDTSAYTRIHRGKVVDATPAPTPMPMIKFNPFDAKRRKAKSDADPDAEDTEALKGGWMSLCCLYRTALQALTHTHRTLVSPAATEEDYQAYKEAEDEFERRFYLMDGAVRAPIVCVCACVQGAPVY